MAQGSRHRRPAVVIVGGGYTGAAVAYHLAAAGRDVDTTVVEPRPVLGAGLAYSSADPTHRINVPAHRMSLLPAAPTHFADWLAASGLLADDPAATASGGRVFPRRAVFGRYVGEQLAPHLESGAIVHRRDRAVAVARIEAGYTVSLGGGDRLAADIVVLATTHPAPKVPEPLRTVAGQMGFVPDVYAQDALASVERTDTVLVVGNGLTAADTVATLDAHGHRGRIVALSRRGLQSRGHADGPRNPQGDFTTVPIAGARALLSRIRAELARTAGEGLTWHSVIDALRQQSNSVWAALDPAERSRLVRHLRVFWDVHRFRIAPQLQAVMERRIADGTVAIIAGTLQAAEMNGDRFRISYRPRGRTPLVTAVFDRIVVTTGPEHAAAIAQNPALASLAEGGLVRPDPIGLGLETTRQGQAVGADGAPVAGLFVAGPLARATVGDLMGLTQVTRHAEMIAGEIAAVAVRGRAMVAAT